MTAIIKDLDPVEIASRLDSEGFVCVPDAVAPEWLDRARAHIAMLASERQGRYFALNWPSRDEGSPWQEMTNDAVISRLMSDLVTLGCPKAKIDDEIYNVLRV